MQITVVFAGEVTPATWSGTAYSLVQALSEHAAVRVISAELPRKLVRLIERSHISESTHARLRTALVRWRLRRVQSDVVIQMSTSFAIPRGEWIATFEDATVRQMERFQDPWFLSQPAAVRQAWARRQADAYERAQAILVASSVTRDSVVQDYGIDPAKVHVVGIGYDGRDVPHAGPWHPPRFLTVALDWRRKNVPAVIDAFAEVRRAHPDASLDIVGGYEGAAPPGVVVHGELPFADPAARAKLLSLYEQATCFVMPSANEAFGIAYLEAAGHGIASIGTSAGGARDPVGPDGLLVDPASSTFHDELVAAMRSLADPKTAQRRGEASRSHAAHFTWPHVADRIIAALAGR